MIPGIRHLTDEERKPRKSWGERLCHDLHVLNTHRWFKSEYTVFQQWVEYEREKRKPLRARISGEKP